MYSEKKVGSVKEKSFCKFDAVSQEVATFLGSLEQFIQTV
jgi:hypothetical protein